MAITTCCCGFIGVAARMRRQLSYFLCGEEKGYLDLSKARRGGFASGLFAIFVPSSSRKKGALPTTIEVADAQQAVFAMASLLFWIERDSRGRVRVCRHVGDIESCLADNVLAAVLHIEGAEAIDADFAFLEVLRTGLYREGVTLLTPDRRRGVLPLIASGSNFQPRE